MLNVDFMNSKKTLYFAYGSNLDFEDWSNWCLDRNVEPSGLVEVEPAFLPSYRLKFHYYSSGRKGGAADIIEADSGNIVPGALFELDDYTLNLMDRKEGVKGGAYQRKQVHVVTLEGRIIEALTYVVCKERIQNEFIEPTLDYVNLIRNGLSSRGLPTEFLDSALNFERSESVLNRIFVYGTLMKDESRYLAIKNADFEFINGAFTKGKLLHLNDYPGLIFDDKDQVSGELYQCDNINKRLSEIDQIEGFHGYQYDGSLFNRVILKVEIKGEFVWSWAYYFNGKGGIEIPSGNWHERD